MSTAGKITLTLAHSPDPDDVFMWWPLTGMIEPETGGIDASGRATFATTVAGGNGNPAIDTGRFEFKAVPADIAVLNRRAAGAADLDITALSVRTYADVQGVYRITSCGASFGDGFGPKVVCRTEPLPGSAEVHCHNCLKPAEVKIAVPGTNTTAFLLLGMALGERAMRARERFMELPFDRIIPAVAKGDADAGVVIHEGQLTFADAGLRLVLDLGAWWKDHTGLKVPLGINAVKRDLDQRFGPGTLAQVASLLSASVAMSMRERPRSTAYTLPFALANISRTGAASAEKPTLERVDRYCRMYVSQETADMGSDGAEAIARLLREGAAMGLCPALKGPVDLA